MSTRGIERYRQIVERIEAMAQAGFEESAHIGDLCRAAAVNQRTLRTAFHFVHGMPPYRYLRSFRMQQARRALLVAAAEPGVVTRIAMHFGFLELGRFSVEYREIFGECPSQTVLRSRSAPAHFNPIELDDAPELSPAAPRGLPEHAPAHSENLGP